MFRGDRLAALMAEKGLSQSELARRVGVSQATIWKLLKEPSQGSKHLHKIAAELGTTAEYLMGETDDPSPGAFNDRRLPFRAAPADVDHDLSGIVWIKEARLELGLGGAYLDSHVEERSIPFPADWLREYSRAPADKLVVVRGKGSSMEPTIYGGNACLIDLTRQTLDEQDELWACAFGHIGMIKRLRQMPDGSVKIMSDNEAVRDELAIDDELHIIGRCCGVFRRT
jgi:phage repressor protein C with HTH and peptisase S24 domain